MGVNESLRARFNAIDGQMHVQHHRDCSANCSTLRSASATAHRRPLRQRAVQEALVR
jgi:hypothetical protein